MEQKARNSLWFLFYFINAILLLFWGILLFWLIKNNLIWNPLEFFAFFIPIVLICYIPGYFFLRSVVKLGKNFKKKDRFKISKRYIIPSLLIVVFIWSLSILGFILFFFPTALNYENNDGPYLIWNDDPQTTMTVIWHTEEPTETILLYGESLGDMVSYKSTLLEKRHIVELKELTPGSFYYYQISDFSLTTYNFTTAPSTNAYFNFTTISDTHAGREECMYEAVIDAMNSYQYDFIVSAGDVGPDEGENLEMWHRFFTRMVKHATNHPYMVDIGNHEYGMDFFARNFKFFFPYNYPEAWGHYYSFDYSNAHFCMIDVFQNQLDWGGFVLEAQEAWIRQDLAANQDKWLFVVLHASPYSTGDFNMNNKLITQLTPIFYENQVDVVLSGHDHHYEAFWTNRSESWGGIHYFVTGGGGGGLDNSIMTREFNPWKSTVHNASVEPYQFDYNTLHDQLYGELTHQFMHFEVKGNSLTIKAIRDNGTLIQEFNINK